MSEAVNQRILEALNAGYDPQEILGKLSMSKNDEHRSWYENYAQTMRDRAREPSIIEQRPKPSSPGLGIMDRLRSHVEDTSGYQLAAEAAGTAGGLYAGKRAIQRMFPTELSEQNAIARERLEMEKRGTISPLEQARIDTEKTKADLLRKKIEMLDKDLAAKEVKQATATSSVGKPPESLLSTADQNLVLQSEQNRFDKQVEAATKAAAEGEVPGSLKPVTPMQPAGVPAPAVALQTPIATAPTAPPVAPTVAQVAAETAPPVAPTVSQIAQQATPETEGKNKGGRPKGAVSMKDTPETWQKLTKEGTTFLPGYGPGDNNLYNTYGAEGRRAILERYNDGKPIGSYENYLKLNEKLKVGVPSSEVPSLMARLPSEEEAGNFSKLGKAAKIAGVGGLLVGAANLANAKTRGERGMAGANLLEAVLPPGANINEAGAPVLPPNILAAQRRQLEEMQKLGSPYRTR